jgi:hypothetical protein
MARHGISALLITFGALADLRGSKISKRVPMPGLGGIQGAGGTDQALYRDLKGESVEPVRRLYGKDFMVDETL